MTLAASGYIQMGGVTANRSVNIELGRSSTATTSFTESAVRTLTGVSSGPVILPTNFWNKPASAPISYTFTTTTANASLNVTSISGYVAGASNITITVNSGVYLYSTSAGNAGLTLTGGTSGDTITLVNNGYIMGRGGDAQTSYFPGGSYVVIPATVGGPALSLGFNTTITNTSGYIGGGGGAGGTAQESCTSTGGGGAGGGNGGGRTDDPTFPIAIGGAPGSAGSNGSELTTQSGLGTQVYAATSGAGGRILPGTGGGAESASLYYNYYTAAKGLGGGSGGGGSAYTYAAKFSQSMESGGGGGGWGASGGSAWSVIVVVPYTIPDGSSVTGGAGGSAGGVGADGYSAFGGNITVAGTAGGKAVALNGYAVTWTGGSSSSSRAYGAVS